MNRFFHILNTIQNSLSGKECSKEIYDGQETASNYEYECRRCGLVLSFKRNQAYVKCPNDGTTMHRIK